jgi:DMSO/TMAO reductase YedYZ heme-binding membrane subunit
MRNRRYLGLAAAVSHGYHGIFILALYRIPGAGAEETPIATLLGGSFGFLMLAAMAATSNDASQRRLGRHWRRLHWAGVWTLWIIFTFTYVPAALSNPIAAVASAALIASLVLRVWPGPAANQAGTART